MNDSSYMGVIILFIILVGAVSFLASIWSSNRPIRQRPTPPEDRTPPKPNEEPPMQPNLLRDFEKRVSKARGMATGTLLMIALAISLAITLFLSAQNIDDISGLSTLNREVVELQQPYRDLQKIYARHYRHAVVPTFGAAGPNQVVFVVDTFGVRNDTASLGPVLTSLLKAQPLLAKLPARISEAASDPNETLMGYKLLNTALIRIGVVVLLIYTCQILLRLYRYHTLVANHFQALADGIKGRELLGTKSVKDASNLIRPNVDVGYGPRSPVAGFGATLANPQVSPTMET